MNPYIVTCEKMWLMISSKKCMRLVHHSNETVYHCFACFVHLKPQQYAKSFRQFVLTLYGWIGRLFYKQKNKKWYTSYSLYLAFLRCQNFYQFWVKMNSCIKPSGYHHIIKTFILFFYIPFYFLKLPKVCFKYLF